MLTVNKNSRENPKKALPLAITAIKYALPLPVKAKVSLARQGLLLILFLRMIPFTFSPFTTNRTLKTLPIKKFLNL
jgi:hypothetical protein